MHEDQGNIIKVAGESMEPIVMTADLAKNLKEQTKALLSIE